VPLVPLVPLVPPLRKLLRFWDVSLVTIVPTRNAATFAPTSLVATACARIATSIIGFLTKKHLDNLLLLLTLLSLRMQLLLLLSLRMQLQL